MFPMPPFSSPPVRTLRWGLTTSFAAFFFSGCLTSTGPKPSSPLWDTTFTAAGIQFPNGAIENRSRVSGGSNRRVHEFLDKCRSRDTVRIGFIGGSITQGAVSSTPSRRFSSQFTEFIRKAFPNLQSVIEINAGIGATGSRFAASRLQHDVLAQAPDLLVVEFAVNDFGAGTDDYVRGTMEGLVRQALLSDPELPVLLLFMAKGDGQNVQALQGDVGLHYFLPMISWRDAVRPLIDSGKASWGAFYYDDPHPNDTGHMVAARLLYAYLRRVAEEKRDPAAVIPAPLVTNLYQHSGFLTPGDTSITATLDGWQVISGEKGQVNYRAPAGVDTSTLVLRTRRREMTLGIRMKTTDTSSVRVVLNGVLPGMVLSNSYVFEYTKFVQLFASDSATEQTIEIRHAGGAAFDIDYVLYAGQ
jgi:lysophospholipase L1-like esterase